jgi:methionyl-tRNA synthetase
MDHWIYIADGFALSLPMLIFVVLWTLFWKGLALWHSARRGAPAWFIALLIINTVGILELIYLFGVLKLTSSDLFTMGPAGEGAAAAT